MSVSQFCFKGTSAKYWFSCKHFLFLLYIVIYSQLNFIFLFRSSSHIAIGHRCDKKFGKLGADLTRKSGPFWRPTTKLHQYLFPRSRNRSWSCCCQNKSNGGPWKHTIQVRAFCFYKNVNIHIYGKWKTAHSRENLGLQVWWNAQIISPSLIQDLFFLPRTSFFFLLVFYPI